MPVNGEPLLSVRTLLPDIFEIGRDNTVQLEIIRDGVVVGATVAGSLELFDPSQRLVFKADNLNGFYQIIGGVPTATIPASHLRLAGDPLLGSETAIQLGELYQEVWTVTIDASGPRAFRRSAAVARFALLPPIADVDLLVGEYPDLVDALGSQGNTIQPYLDKAFRWAVRRMFRDGSWPDLLVTVADLVEILEHRALFLVFKYLFSKTSGDGSRFETLMDHHRDMAEAEWTKLSGRWDRDHDGVADSLERESAGGVIHQNAAPRSRLRRTSRW